MFESEARSTNVIARDGGRAAFNYYEMAPAPCPSCEVRFLSEGKEICRHCETARMRENEKQAFSLFVLGFLMLTALLNWLFDWLGIVANAWLSAMWVLVVGAIVFVAIRAWLYRVRQ